MLPKKERLSRAEFNRFFSLGKRKNSVSFQMVYAKAPGLHASVVVSKKVSPSAVKRNVIRRRIYDIVRRYRDETKLEGVMIFVVGKKALSVSYENLKEEVRECMKAVNV